MLKGHGDDIHGEVEIKANFSTNIYYKSDNSWLKDFLDSNWKCLNNYPEPDAHSLKKCLAKHHNLATENFIIGNGATEIFYLVAHAFIGRETLIPIPSFAEYEDACNSFNHNIAHCCINELKEQKDNYDLVIICNPNNPNGHIYKLEEIETYLNKHKETTLLIDEAFIDFITEDISAVDLIHKYTNLLVCKSMTKNYAIPGLRLGYLIGNKELIEKIEQNKQPWSVNSLAIEAGKYAITNSTKLLPKTIELREDKNIFQKQINNIEGFQCIESHAPFFLVKTKADSNKLKTFLLENHSILIRDASNFKSLNNHYFRVNTLDSERNNLLLKALQEYEF